MCGQGGDCDSDLVGGMGMRNVKNYDAKKAYERVVWKVRTSRKLQWDAVVT